MGADFATLVGAGGPVTVARSRRTAPGPVLSDSGRRAGEVTGMGRIRCVLGDRSVFFTEGLRAILRQSPVATIIGTTQTPEEVPARVLRSSPAAVWVSFEPPPASLAVARIIPDVPVLVLTWSRREDDLLDALRAGATGFLHKEIEPEELLEAIDAVAAGRTAFPLGWERLLVSRLDGHRPPGHRVGDPV